MWPEAARRVAQRYVLGPIDGDEVLVGGVGLDIVLHLLAQGTLRVVQHPQPAQAVLHHVAHDPLGREQLGGRRQRFGRGLVLRLEERVLGLGVVVLVHPAQDLHVAQPVGLGDARHHGLDDAALRHEAVGQQQLHGVAHRLEHARQARGQLAALAQQQVAKQRLVVAGLLQLHHARRVHTLELDVERLVERLRAERARLV